MNVVTVVKVQVQHEGKHSWKIKLEDIYISVIKICSFSWKIANYALKKKNGGENNNKL